MNCKYCKADCIFRGEQQTKECKGYIPMTNADRIRDMSDEEFAKWFSDLWDCSDCSEHERLGDNPLLREEPCDQKCEEHCLEWLKQPAE